MAFEVRLAFLVFFFLLWTLSALLPWAGVALWRRGRGGLLALPLAVAAAWACGVAVPAAGMRDVAGLLLSLVAASAGSLAGALAGVEISRRIEASRPPKAPTRPPPLTRPPKEEAAQLDPPAPPR